MRESPPEPRRQRNLSVKVSETTIESLWPLQVHYGLSRAELIERLVEDALEARERENSERSKPTPITRVPLTAEDDEPDGGSRPTLDANGRWQP